ncbi:MAG: segregation and condensation protein [Candidatus Diapherotrites archaeon]|nr:segregation and condensation protein [Candidatus Diapherotrites archaeon]MDN5366815.1 segregation and condensation protein [Candidatus Diapherotrites archaeon]
MKNRPEPRRIIEAALFLSPRPLSIAELSKLADVPPHEVAKILDDLESRYRSIDSALVFERLANAVRLYVHPDVFPHVKELAAVPEFTKRELEVVAYLAVHGSATRPQLRKIYSNADRVVDKLRSLGAVIVRKSGKTYEIKKTELFDRYFGVTQQQ